MGKRVRPAVVGAFVLGGLGLALLTVVLAIWAGDTLAYAGGRLLGRHRMAPSTSPGP